MANAIVEKAKAFGIHHGEKVAVALVSALTLVMLVAAVRRESIDITPDQITSATNQARQNLQKDQPKDEIVKKITDQGIVQPGFVQVVDARKPGTADASRYQLTNLMVTPEPGAGLLRDAPELISIARLEIHPGRGAIKLYQTDPKTGELLSEDSSDDQNQPKARIGRRTKKRNNRGGAMGGMGSMMGRNNRGGMAGAAGGQETDKQKRDREKAESEKASLLKKSIAGNVAPDESKKDEEKAEPASGANYKTALHGFRWMAFTAWIDHKKLRDNYARALKIDPAAAHPHYLRVELERQQRQTDGSWSAWKPVDRNYTEDTVLGLLTEAEAETNEQGLPITPEDVRLPELVDQLPFLENGYWVGVHHADLINTKVLETPKKKAAGGMGAMSGMAAMGGMGGPMNEGGMGGTPSKGGTKGGGGMGAMGGMPSRGSAGGRGPASDDEGTGGFGRFFSGGTAAGAAADTNFKKSDAEKVLVRQLDFTVEPDSVYRYRARIVVANPNFGSNDVMPGVDRDSKELYGPWSDSSPVAMVPPDVETYVHRLPPADVRVRRPDLVEFNVVRWNPDNGLTLVRPFTQGPGDVVGGPVSANMPVEEKGKTRVTSKPVDFTSHRVLVDTSGGSVSSDRLGVNTIAFSAPATALLLRADGMIELRDEASDAVAGEMDEMLGIYKQTLKDAAGEKQSSQMTGAGMGGMGGGYGGMGMGMGGSTGRRGRRGR